MLWAHAAACPVEDGLARAPRVSRLQHRGALFPLSAAARGAHQPRGERHGAPRFCVDGHWLHALTCSMIRGSCRRSSRQRPRAQYGCALRARLPRQAPNASSKARPHSARSAFSLGYHELIVDWKARLHSLHPGRLAGVACSRRCCAREAQTSNSLRLPRPEASAVPAQLAASSTASAARS